MLYSLLHLQSSLGEFVLPGCWKVHLADMLLIVIRVIHLTVKFRTKDGHSCSTALLKPEPNLRQALDKDDSVDMMAAAEGIAEAKHPRADSKESAHSQSC